MKMLPRTEHVYCDLPGHIHVFKVVPPVPSNFRKWAVDGEALEVHGNGPPLEQFVFQISGAGKSITTTEGGFLQRRKNALGTVPVEVAAPVIQEWNSSAP